MTPMEKFRNLPLGNCLMIGFFVALAYYLVFYNSGSVLQTNIQARKSEIQDLQHKIADEDKKIAQIEQFKKATQVMGQDFQSLVAYIPAKFGSFDLMRSVSNEAKAAGINISRINESAAAEKMGFYEQFKVRADLTGSFQQIMLFLSFLTRTEQIMTVPSLELRTDSRSSNPTDTPTLRFNVEIFGYRYLPDAARETKSQ
jgi:Tfp pilus assembly protein PilO